MYVSRYNYIGKQIYKPNTVPAISEVVTVNSEPSRFVLTGISIRRKMAVKNIDLGRAGGREKERCDGEPLDVCTRRYFGREQHGRSIKK